MLGAAARTDDPPVVLWILGIPLTLFFGYMLLRAIIFRLMHPDPEDRRRRRDQFLHERERIRNERRSLDNPVNRSSLAYRATKHRKEILRCGVDGTALVTFIADGGRGNDVEQLVYLELEVSVAGGAPYEVRTGEFLTAASSGSVAPGRRLAVKVHPTDRLRVAVDWERSLRLRRDGPDQYR